MKIGSLVECIKGPMAPNIENGGEIIHVPQVIIGQIYTVRDFTKWKNSPAQGILVEEIVNDVIHWVTGDVGEPGYRIERFREIQPPMDISIESIISQPETV